MSNEKTLLGPETRTPPEFCIKYNHSFEFVGIKYGRSIHYEKKQKLPNILYFIAY